VNATTDALFSPREDLVVTCVANKGKTGKGSIVMFSRRDFTKVAEIPVSDQSAIRLLWHPKLNEVERHVEVVVSADAQWLL